VGALDTFWHVRSVHDERVAVWASARVVALATAEFAGSVALIGALNRFLFPDILAPSKSL